MEKNIAGNRDSVSTKMNRKLQSLINERIERKRQSLIGHALSIPYLKPFVRHIKGDIPQTYSVWVVDVLVKSNHEKLTGVPLAESGRKVRDFVNVETPLEITRSATGQFYVVGLSDRKKGLTSLNTYSLAGAKLQFTDGWKLDGGGLPNSGNQNQMNPGTPQYIEYQYTVYTVRYGDLDYGTTIYGATAVLRTP